MSRSNNNGCYSLKNRRLAGFEINMTRIAQMPEVAFFSVPQFLQALIWYPNFVWIYRGESDLSRPIIPKAGRKEYFLADFADSEGRDLPPRDLLRFNQWRKLAIAYKKKLPKNDFDCLAYAQHYGLATRMLDWTSNPLVALFFAVDSCSEKDGAVYCYAPYWTLKTETTKLGELAQIAKYIPPPFDKRILLQCGVLTYMPDPKVPLTPGPIHDLHELTPEHKLNLVRFVVKADMKRLLKDSLDQLGINRKFLFPDLEGLSNYINDETSKTVKMEATNRKEAN